MPPQTRGGQWRGVTPTQEERSGDWTQAEGPGKIFQASAGELSLNPQTHMHAVGGLMPQMPEIISPN